MSWESKEKEKHHYILLYVLNFKNHAYILKTETSILLILFYLSFTTAKRREILTVNQIIVLYGVLIYSHST